MFQYLTLLALVLYAALGSYVAVSGYKNPRVILPMLTVITTLAALGSYYSV